METKYILIIIRVLSIFALLFFMFIGLGNSLYCSLGASGIFECSILPKLIGLMFIFSIFVIIFLCFGTFSKYPRIRLILGVVLIVIVVLFLVFSRSSIVDSFDKYFEDNDFGCYFSDRKDDCWKDWALLKNDTKYCQRDSSGYCFSRLAWERGDTSLCEKIDSSKYQKSYCYFILGIKKLDKSLCDKGFSISKDVKSVNEEIIQREFDRCINAIDMILI